MKIQPQTYIIIKKIHLYTSLSIIAVFLMYLVTSFMMIHHNSFEVTETKTDPVTIDVEPSDIIGDQWSKFLKSHKIKGRLASEWIADNQEQIKRYVSPATTWLVKVSQDKSSVIIERTFKNTSGAIIGIHRQRGYGGTLTYNIFALLADMVGLSLILFAITGIILWLQMLNHSKTAWIILIVGSIYFFMMVGYLTLY